MKHILLLAGLTAMIGFAGPAQADPTGSEAAFLNALSGAGLTHSGADQAAVAAGRAVCQLMDGGLSSTDTVVAVQTTNPGFSLQHAAEFAAISAAAFCPEHV